MWLLLDVFCDQGGVDTTDGGVFVSDIKEGGNLDLDGRFYSGDRILSINGLYDT